MLPEELIRTIDQRILALTPGISRTWGTVAYHSSNFYDYEAQVVFDGSAVALPVRVPGSVIVKSGDRVICEKFGPIWVIVDGWPRRWLDQQYVSQQLTTGDTTSATFETMPTSPTITWAKIYNDTRITVAGTMSAFTVAGVNGVAFGVRIIGPDGANTVDQHIARYLFNTTDEHQSLGGLTIVSDPLLTAGLYEIVPVWARYNGASTINTDAHDWVTLVPQEIQP